MAPKELTTLRLKCAGMGNSNLKSNDCKPNELSLHLHSLYLLNKVQDARRKAKLLTVQKYSIKDSGRSVLNLGSEILLTSTTLSKKYSNIAHYARTSGRHQITFKQQSPWSWQYSWNTLDSELPKVCNKPVSGYRKKSSQLQRTANESTISS